MRRRSPPPPGGPKPAAEGDTQVWPRSSTSILAPPTASPSSRQGPTSPITHESDLTCSGSPHVSALAPYGRPWMALFGRPLTPDRGRRQWINAPDAQRAVYGNRRRLRGERGQGLL